MLYEYHNEVPKVAAIPTDIKYSAAIQNSAAIVKPASRYVMSFLLYEHTTIHHVTAMSTKKHYRKKIFTDGAGRRAVDSAEDKYVYNHLSVTCEASDDR